MTCDHNCFECPYPDCICEDEETATEKRAARRRDKLLTKPKQVDAERARKARPKKIPTPEELEARRAKMRAYREAHKDELNAKQRQRYATDPEYRAKCKANTAKYWRDVRKARWQAARPVKWYDEYGRDYVRAKRKERGDKNHA